MSNHLLDRTSPKGKPFRGKCRYCGKVGLLPAQANEHCPAAPGANQPIIDALESE